MKKIAEMSQAELQDYALSLEGRVSALTEDVSNRDNEIKELRDTNLMLQQRNNKLFMQVEAGTKPEAEESEEEETVESCEDFALKNIKEIMNT